MSTSTMSTTTSIQSDMSRFSTALQQWTQTYTKLINDTNTHHTNTAHTTKQQLTTLATDKENTQSALTTLQHHNTQAAQVNGQLNGEMNKLQHAATTLPKKQAVLQSTQQQYQTMITTLQQQVKQLEQQKHTTIHDIAQGIAVFKNVLGIQFDVLQKPRGVLRITFKYIQPSDPTAEHSADIYVDATEQYVLADCRPVVDGAQQLVDQLNRHNRFDVFVMKLRMLFQEYAATKQ